MKCSDGCEFSKTICTMRLTPLRYKLMEIIDNYMSQVRKNDPDQISNVLGAIETVKLEFYRKTCLAYLEREGKSS